MLLLAGPLALAAALGGGYLLARTALAPVDRMAAAADQITATRLDRRLEAPHPDDELGRLARTLNGMIARLERSFERDPAVHRRRGARAADAAGGDAERGRGGDPAPRDPEQYRRVLEDMLEEIERLTRLAEQLLFLCREDAGLFSSSRRPVRLDDLVIRRSPSTCGSSPRHGAWR